MIALVALVACGSPRHPPATGGSTSGAVPHRLPQKSADVQIAITGKAITMNGVALTGKPTIAQLQEIFGKPDRTWDSGGLNKVHTWDTIGLLAYEPYATDGTSGDGRCISATFTYKPMSQSFSPKQMFAGTIRLDGKTIDPTLVLATVARWPGATHPYTKASIVFDRGDFHLFTIEEQAGEKLDLVELSFWQNAREQRPGSPRVGDPQEDDCRAGDVSHCSSRALALQTGSGGRKNIERAFELVKIACTGGDVFGCIMLGNMHEAGRGTTSSITEAKVAWKRACTLGYKPACDR